MENDMKNIKRLCCLLTLALLSLALLADCGSKDSDLQDTDGIIYEYDAIGAGSIMRNREQIEVLFFYDQETVYIHYNDYFYDLKEPKLLDKAELPSSMIRTGMPNRFTPVTTTATAATICV